MKSLIYFACVLMAVAASAQAPLSIKTTDGKVYNDARLTSIEAEIAVVSHAGGVARIPLVDLPKSVRRSLNIPATVGLARADLERAIAGARAGVSKLDDQYVQHLRKMEEEATKAGLLDRILLIRNEIEQFSRDGEVAYGEFAKLKEARRMYEGQREKRRHAAAADLKPQLVEFQKEMVNLAAALTKSGDLEQASAALEERKRVENLLGDPGRLLSMVAGADDLSNKPEPGDPANDGGGADAYFALVASMKSDVIASVDLSSGKVKVLHKFDEKSAPRGIAVAPSGEIYVGLRQGGMNVVQLTPKEGGGFAVKDYSKRIGEFGPGKLRITDKGDLLIAGDSAGKILRTNLKTGRPKRPMGPGGMGNLVGLAVSGDEVFAIEIFGERIGKLELRNSGARETWLTKGLEDTLQRPTGIAVGHNGNLFVANVENSLIPEFSKETGKLVGVFFDLKSAGAGMSSEIRYVAELENYFVMSQGNILRLDTKGQLLRKYPLDPVVKGGPAIVVVNKKHLAKSLADQL